MLLSGEIRVVGDDLGHCPLVPTFSDPGLDDLPGRRVERGRNGRVTCRMELTSVTRPTPSARDNRGKVGVGMQLQRHAPKDTPGYVPSESTS